MQNSNKGKHITRVTTNYSLMKRIFLCLQCNSVNELSSLPANTAKLGLSAASETDGGQFDNRDYRMDGIQSSKDRILTLETKRTHPSETAEAS